VIAGWALSGPVLGFSDRWQLFVNTVTTTITFLMVFTFCPEPESALATFAESPSGPATPEAPKIATAKASARTKKTARRAGDADRLLLDRSGFYGAIPIWPCLLGRLRQV
jgi:hypothetical protein